MYASLIRDLTPTILTPPCRLQTKNVSRITPEAP
jgi:hypothetical protein